MKNSKESKSRGNVSSRSVSVYSAGGWFSLGGTSGKSCSHTACLHVINNSIMFPWEPPLFAFTARFDNVPRLQRVQTNASQIRLHLHFARPHLFNLSLTNFSRSPDAKKTGKLSSINQNVKKCVFLYGRAIK